MAKRYTCMFHCLSLLAKQPACRHTQFGRAIADITMQNLVIKTRSVLNSLSSSVSMAIILFATYTLVKYS